MKSQKNRIKISWLLYGLLQLTSVLPKSSGATHDEIPQCSLTGVYKNRQQVLQSPNYPDNYPVNTCWDYVIRSPYRCPTKFHIQFLDFFLESSPNCANDYLAIGSESDDDDMDLLCGQVIGIKKYHTPDGILRLRFFSDDSPWTRGKGFKLLVTRLACEKEELQRNVDDEEDDDDTITVEALNNLHKLPETGLPSLFRNVSDQHKPYPLSPLLGWNLPYPPSPSGLYVPGFTGSAINNGLAGSGGFTGSGLPPGWPVTGWPGSFQSNGYPTTIGGGSQFAAAGFPSSAGPVYPGTVASSTEKPCTDNTKTGQAYVQPANYPQGFVQQVNGLNTPQGFVSPVQGYWPGIQQQAPLIPNQYIGSLEAQTALRSSSLDSAEIARQVEGQFTPPLADACCVSAFKQKHLYLSSPGFPRTVFSALLPTQHRDCEFHLEKSSPSVCRARFEFKFFDFGQTRTSPGLTPNNIQVAIGTSKDVCSDDFVEIDGERFCGCRSGYTYNSIWPGGKKAIRLRMGYSGIPSNGFLLEIYQDECNGDELFNTPQRGYGLNGQSGGFGANANGLNGFGTNLNRPNGFGTNTLNGQNGFGTNTLNGQNGFGNGQNGFGNSLNGQNGFGSSLNGQNAFGSSLNAQNGFGVAGFGQQNQFANQLTSLGQYPQLVPQPVQFMQQPFQAFPLTSSTPLNPFATPYRYGRNGRNSQLTAAASAHQPVSVVETNSTRKEYYYFDGDTPSDSPQSRSSTQRSDGPSGTHAGIQLPDSGRSPQPRGRCSFDMSDILKLTVDPMWITKPICYAPLRSWFSNIFG